MFGARDLEGLDNVADAIGRTNGLAVFDNHVKMLLWRCSLGECPYSITLSSGFAVQFREGADYLARRTVAFEH